MAGEPDMVDMIVDRVTERVTEHLIQHLGPQHDALSRRLAAVEEGIKANAQRFAALEQIIDDHAGEIKHDTGFTRFIAGQAFAGLAGCDDQAGTPTDGTSRPRDIDRAANADPSRGAQRVDLDQWGTVVYINPGADPEKAWGEVSRNLRRGRGVS